MVESLRFIYQRPASVVAVWICWLSPQAARADAPLNYLHGNGAKAYPVVALTWGVIGISVMVCVIIAALLIGAVWRSRPSQVEPGGRLIVVDPARGPEWIWIGAGVSTVVLLLALVWTVVVLAQVSSPPSKPPFTIEVTGHRWWWGVRYVSNDPARNFSTANEIHIPVGTPIRLKLTGADVIHSFWIPALTGKTDTIPGQTNETWIEADDTGAYSGQCTEYCGVQHAHMKLTVFADAPDDFKRWWDHQLQSPAMPSSAASRTGKAAFTQFCGSCHAVRGTDAGGVFGPDLSHLMTRKMIAADSLPNRTAYLSGWIADPQAMKPGNLMPDLALTGPELTSIRTYLQTLN